MLRCLPALAFIFFFLSDATYAASAQTPVGADPSPLACPSVPDLPAGIEAAFAFNIPSREILHFISGLAALPAADQKGAFEAAVAAAATSQERDARAAIAGTCPTLDEIYGQVRAKFIVVNRWQLAELSDAKRFAAFSDVVDTAVAALAAGDALSPDLRRAALLPFGAFASPEPPAVPEIAAGCAQPDARAHVIVAVTPRYPPLAAAAATSGSVVVKISLTDTGDVRSATLWRETVGDKVGAADIIRAAILAAAASTYAPEVTKCKPIAGLYLFRVDYKRS